ncbi:MULTISPECIES: sensor histidine kinase [unclassified Sphingopyxis]|uniref:sensor histidine kinase n=1 Tax=unclassified Sphingopyxis TaxID=2614943 RepID=UPI00073692DA|nr:MULTISPECIES: HAMP domain-containing sensor histidine kinase [unclassified Sphingopyxis]KTE36452.1 histidine kinase [Sphingopyxis sp. HIX]KTE83843.1 histidine kinase [Sphingopyxis sp. HXXIV]
MKLRLWPRSLVGQLVLAVAAALFVAQAINYTLLVRGQRQQVLANGGGMAVARIIDALERDRRGGARPDDDGPRKRLPKMLVDDQPFAPPLRAQRAPHLAEHVAGQLAEAGLAAQHVDAWVVPQRPQQAKLHGPARTAIVSAKIGERYVTVRSWLPAEGKRLQGFLIWQTLSLYLLILVPILFIAWRAAQPLRTLTHAVRRDPMGDGPPLVEEGPSDVRDVIGAFNASRARIGAMLADKDRMLGAVGHDLRTPLASLRVRVEAVEDDNLRDKMIATIDEMTAMLSDILAVARSGAGKEAPAVYDPATLLAQLGEEYRAMGKPVVGPDALPPLPPLTGRPLLVRRALRNLVDNALAYAGSATLLVEVAGGELRFVVRDEGPGIDPARIGELIEPFARGEASRNRATGGAGLGLAIAHALAEGEGGRLAIANRTDAKGLGAAIVLPVQA